MKALTTLACASLVANAVFGFIYWQRSHRPVEANQLGPRPAPNREKSDGARTIRDGIRDGSVVPTQASDASTGLVVDAQLAAALKSRDPRALVAALRSSGFPPKYVRDILIWELGDSTREQRNAMSRDAADRPFWRSESRAEALAWEKAFDELDAKNLDITKEVFGGYVPPLPQLMLEHRRYGFLPADKIERVADLDSDYAATRRNAMSSGSGNLVENLALIERERRADLAKILSPAELELYDLNLSASAVTLRRQMPAFEPTESEFRAMYDVRRQFDETHSTGGSINPADVAQRSADDQAMKDKFRAILGDQRYAEYERGQDIGYRTAVEVVRHFNLPAESATATYALQKDAQRQMQEIVKSVGTDPAAAQKATQSLFNETTAKLKTLLGAPGAEAYLKAGGTWLGALPNSAVGPAGGVRRAVR